MLSRCTNFFKRKPDVRYLAYSLLILGLMLYFFSVVTDLSDIQKSKSSEYNQAVELYEEGDYPRAVDKFFKVDGRSPFDSKANVNARYNVAHIILQNARSLEEVLQARELFIEALRSSPSDTDIRKMIEITTTMIIQQYANGPGEAMETDENEEGSEGYSSGFENHSYGF